MGKSLSAIKGTQDVLPSDSYKWQFVEETILETAKSRGYKEIRIPVFEYTELFDRSVGDTTDVVQKEMYTFDDKGGRSLTLRPEGTAGTVRSVIEHGLFNEALPLKVCYTLSCYRYEKPQTGRLREFHQFGIECFGSQNPAADAEVIGVANACFKAFGLKDITLEINSIGCPECRQKYLAALKEYFSGVANELCDTCKTRLEKNPMRILDCKSPVCKEFAAGAPKILDYICDDCAAHFEAVKTQLDCMGLQYVVNPTIVRGLDYYTRTVFEFVATGVGTQGTVCAGGRYDGLVKQMGGPELPALGFAMGLERLMLLLKEQEIELRPEDTPVLYIASLGEQAVKFAAASAEKLRDEGFFVLYDISGKGLKAQMKYADKSKCRFCLVVGDQEISTDKAKLRNMSTGDEKEIVLSDLVKEVYDIAISQAMENLENSIEQDFGGEQ